MSKEVKTHSSEICRWANTPDTVGVWEKSTNDGGWKYTYHPTWESDRFYIVDDEWAEIRKAIIDGDPLQVKHNGQWVDSFHSNLSTFDVEISDGTANLENYRVKPKQVTLWQWLYRDNRTGEFCVTGYEESLPENLKDSTAFSFVKRINESEKVIFIYS